MIFSEKWFWFDNFFYVLKNGQFFDIQMEK